MGNCMWTILVIGFLVGVCLGYPKEDLVEELPGSPKVKFRQYAGYVDVDDKAGRSLFYYFAEADGNANAKPLTLWLNGGFLSTFYSNINHNKHTLI